MKINARVFVEKRENFQVESYDLLSQLKDNFQLPEQKIRLINIYDVFNIEEDILESAKLTVFTEPMTDKIIDEIKMDDHVIVWETLPGQYDQRADSAMQCIKLLEPSSVCKITSGRCVVFEQPLSQELREKIEKYLINPIESRKKNLDTLTIDENVEVTPLKLFTGFIAMTDDECLNFVKKESLAMSHADLMLVRDYFKNEEHRDPTETEIKVLDTYWSDHCRHTTFETCLESIKITTDRFADDIQKAYELYLRLRHENNRDSKPVTLMDMATINSRNLRNKGLASDVEVSEEINACSVFVDVDHDGTTEKWLLMFKNETHNHPTEIEPFGGASTCIGGAIRDPLSGRSYVYQAMRVSGCGNVFETIEETLEGKLPQKVISKKATHGNSSYGNQIGLPTTHVREIYHDSYVAKHMEVGAVVGAAKAENVIRKTPCDGDVVILLGGRTGRDGIGGATGSSKEHNVKSIEVCASEVQKGNAPEERKIQRLFRNPECTKLIKKCNDFGAGGVCVAIGELAEGLEIHLENVRLKYEGLNATEIAISESQERMAVVVAKENAAKFIELAELENLEAYQVAEVTNTSRLVMKLRDEVVVDLSRAFIDTSGVRQSVHVNIASNNTKNVFEEVEINKETILNTLSSKNVACQKGLGEMFDASIGSTTVLMPYGGKYQLTPAQASIQKLPVLDGKTTTCSILTYGFDPKINEYSCYMGAQNSIIQSMAKTIASGGNYKNIYFSFQEYFERMNKDPERWGKVSESLLGAIKCLNYFQLAAIGGKDSMSGTFNNVHVVPTLISFACSTASTKDILTPELKKSGHIISWIRPEFNKEETFNLESIKNTFDHVQSLMKQNKIKSAYAVEDGGVLSALFKMSFGNNLGFEVNGNDLLNFYPGSFVVESEEELEGAIVLGKVTDQDYKVNGIEITYDEAIHAWMSPFENLYPTVSKATKDLVVPQDTCVDKVWKAKELVDEVHVLIPVFPGSNCEFDTARAFEEEGAKTHIFVFRNQTEQMIFDSIDKFEKQIDQAHILAFPGGFSSGDEPDGSAKFIVNVLQNERIKNAVHRLLDRDGLILGICNGFQALVKSGLLPYGRIQTLSEEDPTLFRNNINRHVSTVVTTRVASNNSPWLAHMTPGEIHSIPVSHGEGKFVVREDLAKELFDKGCVAFQYCDPEGTLTSDSRYNINGSYMGIEGIVSFDGHILGKMGHSERYCSDVFKNIQGNKKQSIFRSGVAYFKK